MKDIFLVLATIITVIGVIPYLKDILKGKTKPNLVSWVTWTLLTVIATAAEISAGEYVAAIFTAAAAFETGLVVVLGLFKKAYVKYTRFDIACQLAAVVGIVLWQMFDSPAIAVIAAVTIDFIGALPTFRHSYQKPEEETWITFALSGVGGFFGVLALETYNFVSLPYALYIVLINILMAFVIIVSARRKLRLNYSNHTNVKELQ